MFQALCSLLRRDASINFKAKGNSLVSVLACNLLMAAYEEDENWPEIFVKVVESRVLLLASGSGGQPSDTGQGGEMCVWESRRAAEELFPLQVKVVARCGESSWRRQRLGPCCADEGEVTVFLVLFKE